MLIDDYKIIDLLMEYINSGLEESKAQQIISSEYKCENLDDLYKIAKVKLNYKKSLKRKYPFKGGSRAVYT